MDTPTEILDTYKCILDMETHMSDKSQQEYGHTYAGHTHAGTAYQIDTHIYLHSGYG
jgi:hypothetical protein